VVAKLMGHSSTRMVDLVYGKLNEENYRTAAGRLPSLDLPEPGSRCGAKGENPETREKVGGYRRH
jgi:hypothetical protein